MWSFLSSPSPTLLLTLGVSIGYATNVCEARGVQLLVKASVLAGHAKRKTVTERDLQTLKQVEGVKLGDVVSQGSRVSKKRRAC